MPRFVTSDGCEPCAVGRQVLQEELGARAWTGARPVRLQVVEATAQPDLLTRYGGRLPVPVVGDAVLTAATDRVRAHAFLATCLDNGLA